VSHLVSVGIHVPSSAVAALDSGEAYAEFFRQVEALGLDAVWTEDRIFHDASMLDPLMLLASAAACTRRIELGTAVLVVTLRAAAVVARHVSTLHHLAGGRVALGVSLGGRPEEYKAVGVPMNRRVTVFRESVAVIRKLLAGGPVDHEGQFFRVDQFAIFGPARAVAARLVEHVEAGITKLMLGVPDLDPTQLRRVAHEVVPAVRSAAAQ
jgi:alkanesulfonate monooxygenase SsuD/methylene tetrahydromethanopterin reductase-like flavin-dependent oxidoreductase (luciferase family)